MEDDKKELPQETKPAAESVNKSAIVDVISELPFGKFLVSLLLQEGKALRQGWVAFLILCAISGWFGYHFTSDYYESHLKDDYSKLADSNSKNSTLQTRLDIASQSLATLEAIADKQYKPIFPR